MFPRANTVYIPEWFTGWSLWYPPPPHFGWPKMNFDRISRHFRSIHNFLYIFFFHKMAAGGHFGWPKIIYIWLPAAILDDRKSPSITFLAISNQYATFIYFLFCSQNGCRRTFRMTENPLSISFLAISDQYATFFLICSQNGCRRPSWMAENHFRSHFSPFQINTQL